MTSVVTFLLAAIPVFALVQTSTPPATPPTTPPQPLAAKKRQGGFVPGQKRAPDDPAIVARGKTLFDINCRGCHGSDLRGGDMGGPNLLRSPAALSDQHGELIVPIIQGARQNMGMPAINISQADAEAAAAYVRSVIESIEGQGKPPSEGHSDPDIIVGNANRGKVYFDSKCSSCHSTEKDLKGLATRITDQKRLQTTWVEGGRWTGELDPQRTPTADVTNPSGEVVTGLVIHLDEFLITLKLPDGTERSIARESASEPKVVVHDPLEKHRELLSQYTDGDIHDVTAYLVTLK